MEHIVMTIICQRGKLFAVPIIIFCYFLHISDNRNFSDRWQFAENELEFVFVMFVNLTLDTSLKLNEGLDKFIKGSNWYPYRGMDTLGVNESIARIIKSGVNMQHPSGMFMKANGSLQFCYLCSQDIYVLGG